MASDPTSAATACWTYSISMAMSQCRPHARPSPPRCQDHPSAVASKRLGERGGDRAAWGWGGDTRRRRSCDTGEARSLVVALVQAMAHHATRVWVVEEEDRNLVGVVDWTHQRPIDVLRNHPNQPPPL
jgi:hypothetical protein